MNIPSQSLSPINHEASNVPIPNHELSRDGTQTVVVERRGRMLLSKPNTLRSTSYSMVTVENVEVVKTSTTVHFGHSAKFGRVENITGIKKVSDLNLDKARAITGRARYMNSFQQRHYHYLPNGPARRSRYDLPPKQRLRGPSAPFIPPTTHVIHGMELSDEADEVQNRNNSQTSPSPSVYSLAYAKAPFTKREEQSSIAANPSPSCTRPQRELKGPGDREIITPSHTTQSTQLAALVPPPSPSRFDPDSLPSNTEHEESHTSEATNPREGLGSREHELRELKEFWREFYDLDSSYLTRLETGGRLKRE